MSTDRWSEVRDLFEAALDHTPETRAAFLDEACADDPVLRREIDSLLDSLDDEDSFLGAPALDSDLVRTDAPLFDRVAGSEQYLGTEVGPYHIDEVLGTGGMGAVFLAHRTGVDFRQQVAIKFIHDALASEHLLQRFRQEGRVLARLNHPHIARLLGGGVADSGLPYLVMEYVDGQPLTDYVREHRLSLDERLALFETICQAVQAAHQALIVHRDLKPSNIMVAGDGTVKLLDFGIAKLLTEPDPGSTTSLDVPLTRTGMRAMTPEYAAPEQVQGRAITTATDVYALGVVLYELLADQRPYELREKSPTEIERIVCEQLPRPPSDVATLGERLRGDLDTIVMKALAKEPERRYRTAEALGEDIRRHRVGLPVAARPDTVSYRVSRFVRRHRLGVAAAAVVVLLLAALGVVSTVFAVTTARQAEAVEREAAKAESVNAFLEEVLASASPEADGYDVTVVEALRSAAARIDSLAEVQPEVGISLYHTLGKTYFDLGRYDTSRVLLSEGMDLALAHYGDSLHQDIAALLNTLTVVAAEQGNLEEAIALGHRDVALSRALYGEISEEVGTSLGNLGYNYMSAGEYDTAEPYLLEALATDEAALGREHLSVAIDHAYLSILYRNTGDLARADSFLRVNLDLLRTYHPDESVRLANSLSNLGIVLDNREAYTEAEAMHREALALYEEAGGPNHPNVAWVLSNLASVRSRQGAWDDAEALQQRALAIDRITLDEGHPNIGVRLNNMAATARDRGHYVRADSLYRAAIAIFENALGPDHPFVGHVMTSLGITLLDQDRPAEARQTLEDALTINVNALGEAHENVALTRSHLGAVLLQQGRYREAETNLLAAHEGLHDAHGPDHRFTQTAGERLAALYTAWNKPEQAATYLPATGS